MPWDSDKSTAADPDNPNADEQLTADEWDNHVSEGHFPSDELNFGVDGNGDPVITDPQNGGQTVMRYNRSAGSWVVNALEADEITNAAIITGNQNGSDADSRLDNALSAATNGDIIILEPQSYTKNRTGTDSIDKRLKLIGKNANDTIIESDWSLQGARSRITNCKITNSATVGLDGAEQFAHSISCTASITISGNGTMLSQITQTGSVTFESGSADGSIGIVNQSLTITDNGSNRVI